MSPIAKRRRPLVAVTLGDPSGVGPEVTAKALANAKVKRALTPIVFGDEGVWTQACRLAKVEDRLERVSAVDQARGPALLAVTSLSERDRLPGKPTKAGGKAQLAYLQRAVEELKKGGLNALCTAPLSKAQVSRAGLSFSGHTEYLAEHFGSRVLMMLAGPILRVAVHTTHLAISEVPAKLSTSEILVDLKIMHQALRDRFGIRRPRLAVCALNPHAGDHGIFGDEEARIIAPAIAQARKQRIDAQGPFPADGLFPLAARGDFDAVLAMYHDQGLIPLKLLHFDEGVNVTLGLPIVRTSPDHGVAYDIAGKGHARPQSMETALLMAADMANGAVDASK